MKKDKQFHQVDAIHDGIYNTQSGRQINLLAPTPEMFDIEDIVCALSKICRFGGQINEFYTVAQHSVLVACAAGQYHYRDIMLEALMHDAAEAYLGDVIGPLKVLLGDTYKNLETEFMKCISIRFQLNPTALSEVKHFDKQLLIEEHYRFQLGQTVRWQHFVNDLDVPYPGAWDPYQSAIVFMEYYKRLKRI